MARKLDASIKSVIAHVQSTTDSNELLGAILGEFGGPQELAKEIKRGYDDAQGMAKQRYMEMFQRLVLFTTKEDLSGKVDSSEMSDDELFEAAKSVIRRMKEAGEVIEVDDSPEDAAPVDRSGPDEDFRAEPIDAPIPHDAEVPDPPELETKTLSKNRNNRSKPRERSRGRGKPDLTWLMKSHDEGHFFE